MATTQRIGARALTALLPDLGQQAGPRYLALSAAISGLLLDGRIAPGVRLPSERDLATALQLSRSTATAGYERLAGEGLLIRRRGSGSYLRLPPDARVTGPGGRLNRQAAGTAVLDLSIAALPALPGLLEDAAGRAVQKLGGYTGDIGYQPYGIPALRQLVAQRYAERGVPTEPEQILITDGAQHGLDLLLRLGVSAGDRVITELPTYPGALEAIRGQGGRVVAAPLSGEGWDAAALRNALLQSGARMAYLIPDFHNPTGGLVGDEQREAVLAAARRSGTTVLVDESFVELDLRDPAAGGAASARSPLAMAAIDSAVVSIGSLSKPIWGGLRIGWIRAEQDAVSRLAILRTRSDMAGSVLDQLVACEVLAELDATAAIRRAELRAKRDVLLAELAAKLPDWRPSMPAGGLSTWVELDAPAATALTHLLEQRGVLLTPGSRFAVDGTLERFLRIPFSLPIPDLVDAVGIIATGWQQLDHRRAHARDLRVRVPA